jgi:hypothetical protein
LLFQSGFCGGPVKIRWQGRARGGIEVAYLVEQPDEVEELGMAVVKLGMRSSPIRRSGGWSWSPIRRSGGWSAGR